MRSKFLVLGLILALASVASAVPTGPGGTIYIGSTGNTGVQVNGLNVMDFYYVQVDANWNAVTPGSAGGACVQITTVTNQATPSSNGNWGTTADMNTLGSPEIFTSGNGAPGAATLMIGAYYNNTNYTTSLGSNCDFLQLKAGNSPIITNVNDGYKDTNDNPALPSTTSTSRGIVVDSTFMPAVTGSGNKNRGWFADTMHANNFYEVWQDTDGSGQFVTDAKGGSTSSRHSNNMGDVDWEFVPGFGLFSNENGELVRTTYNSGTNTYTMGTVMHANDGTQSRWIGGHGFAVGDTQSTPDNKYDVYYTNTDGNVIYHAIEDSDGTVNLSSDSSTFASNAAAQAAGSGNLTGLTDMELVKCPNGLYALLVQLDDANAATVGRALEVFGLNADGDWDGTVKVIITQGASTVANDSTFPGDAFKSTNIEFDAVPEPATMLLVGTGILGVAGVLRRRMMH